MHLLCGAYAEFQPSSTFMLIPGLVDHFGALDELSHHPTPETRSTSRQNQCSCGGVISLKMNTFNNLRWRASVSTPIEIICRSWEFSGALGERYGQYEEAASQARWEAILVGYGGENPFRL